MQWRAGAGLGLALLAGPVAARTPVIGQPAPDFHLTTFDKTNISLADLKGEVIVLNFWATWCVPCKAELPRLEAFYRLNHGAGLRILAVATEDSVPMFKLRPLAAALTIPFVQRFHGDYGPVGGAVPTNFVIDRAGVVRYAKAGAFDVDELNDLLVPLLKEAPPSPTVVTVAGP